MPFAPGKSGNPGGRRKSDPELREACRRYTKEAIKVLVKWMRCDDPKASVTAAVQLLDRGHGRPAQVMTGPDGDSDVRVIIRHLFTGAEP